MFKPKMSVEYLVCPKHSRNAASHWKTLKSKNISYFLNPVAVFDDSVSVLAGDRNIRALPNGTFEWDATQGLHGDHGNLVFADGHVEQDVTSDRLNAVFSGATNGNIKLIFP